jgi:hypothetical protein
VQQRRGGLQAAYGLARSASLLSPETAERQRQAAIARNQAQYGIPFGPDHPPPKRTGIPQRLASRIRASEAHKRIERDDAERERAVGERDS